MGHLTCLPAAWWVSGLPCGGAGRQLTGVCCYTLEGEPPPPPHPMLPSSVPPRFPPPAPHRTAPLKGVARDASLLRRADSSVITLFFFFKQVAALAAQGSCQASGRAAATVGATPCSYVMSHKGSHTLPNSCLFLVTGNFLLGCKFHILSCVFFFIGEKIS